MHTLHWNYELKAASTEDDESKSLEENYYRNINNLLRKAIKMSTLQNGLQMELSACFNIKIF